MLAAHRSCAARLGAALAGAWDRPGAWPERRRSVAPVLEALRQGRAHAVTHEPPPRAEEMLIA